MAHFKEIALRLLFLTAVFNRQAVTFKKPTTYFELQKPECRTSTPTRGQPQKCHTAGEKMNLFSDTVHSPYIFEHSGKDFVYNAVKE